MCITGKSFEVRHSQQSKHPPSKCSTNSLKHASNVRFPSVTTIIPVFGTEEALVEPMLFALDTTVPFLAVSAKKPTERDRWHQRSFTARPEIDWHANPSDQKHKVTITKPKYQMIWQTTGYELTEYSLGSKPLSLKAPSVCRAITRQQKMEKGENRGLKAGIIRGKLCCPKYINNRPIATVVCLIDSLNPHWALPWFVQF